MIRVKKKSAEAENPLPESCMSEPAAETGLHLCADPAFVAKATSAEWAALPAAAAGHAGASLPEQPVGKDGGREEGGTTPSLHQSAGEVVVGPVEETTRQSEEAMGQPGESKRRMAFGNFLKFNRGAEKPPRNKELSKLSREPEEKPKTGWVSPTYSLSRSVALDPGVLAANRCVFNRKPDSVEVDAYRVLRTKILQLCKERGGNTIMMTSAVPGEGKTLNAINLAVTLAREFTQTVLLVDCDLRRQSIHHYLGYESDKGLIDYLLNDTPVSELITWPGIEKLTVISGGRPISGSSELLGSPRMKELVADMKSRYPERYVIFDVPPLLAGADALAFVPLVDHVAVVVREGSTSALNINKALQMIPAEKLLGLVLNRQRSMSDVIQYPVRRSFAG